MGLYLSFLLVSSGYRVRLLDGNNKAGGHARPINFFGSKIEIFYHFFYKNDHFNSLKWINSLKAKNEIVWKKINTEIIYKKKNNNNLHFDPDKIVNLIKVVRLVIVIKMSYLF